MVNKHPSTHLSYIFLLIFCRNFLTNSQQCECQSTELYAIKSRYGVETFALDGSHPENITLQRFNESDVQFWKLQPVGKVGRFYIINGHNSKALDFKTGDGGYLYVVLRDLAKSLQQQWNIGGNGNIVNAANLKHIRVVSAKYEPGNGLQLWADKQCTCQRFLLQKKV